MKGYIDNIQDRTNENHLFRKVLYTGRHVQLVLMSLPPGGDIGEEVHGDTDQFFRVESGVGEVVIDGVVHEVSDDFAVIVPAGARHNVINTSDSEDLKLYTIYGPPHHADGTTHATKEDAEGDDEEWTGETTESL